MSDNGKDRVSCGIITYHFAMNYGAVLQCYGLKTSLENNGIKAEVIHYVSEKQNNNNALYRKGCDIRIVIKNLMLFPFQKVRSARLQSFQKFLTEWLLEADTVPLSSIESLKKDVENKYDYIISGSDQVWNPRIADFNEAFFFPFETKVKKIGYAVSTGSAPAVEVKPFAKYIDQFEIVTVREKTTMDVLSEISNKEMTEVCDPVFLLEREEWKKLISEVEYENYLLCYFVNANNLAEKVKLAERIAKEKQLSVLILSARITKYNFTHNVISDAGPSEFLSLFAKASYICTDSFHGTSFSLIFNKDFTTVERKQDSADGRKKNILQKVNALQRIHYLGEDWQEPDMLEYDDINIRLNEIRLNSLTTLVRAIEN